MDDWQEGRDPGRGRRAGSPWSGSGVFGFHQTHAGVRGFPARDPAGYPRTPAWGWLVRPETQIRRGFCLVERFGGET
jgi:hypothetical protein